MTHEHKNLNLDYELFQPPMPYLLPWILALEQLHPQLVPLVLLLNWLVLLKWLLLQRLIQIIPLTDDANRMEPILQIGLNKILHLYFFFKIVVAIG